MSKLASELQSASIKKWVMFQAFWLINATATFLFGLEFVGVVFEGLYSMLPIQQGTAVGLAAFTGGVASLVVLDIAYKGWQWQAMNTAETMAQVTIARAMGWFSFLLSCAYSAIVLVLAMPLFGLTGEQVAWVHMFGGVSFIVITIAHLLAAVVYEQSSISYRERVVQVSMSANKETERLDFIEKVQKQALLQTREQIEQHAGRLAGDFQAIWAGQLLEATRPEQVAARQLPSPAPSSNPSPRLAPAPAPSTAESFAPAPAPSRGESFAPAPAPSTAESFAPAPAPSTAESPAPASASAAAVPLAMNGATVTANFTHRGDGAGANGR